MARVVVDVMPKPEILDPQGKAVLGALPRLGFTGVTEVRQGKRFELEIDGEATPAVLAEVEQMAETLLSNPVIEDFRVSVVEPAPVVTVVPRTNPKPQSTSCPLPFRARRTAWLNCVRILPALRNAPDQRSRPEDSRVMTCPASSTRLAAAPTGVGV